jgi:hypothetical protein
MFSAHGVYFDDRGYGLHAIAVGQSAAPTPLDPWPGFLRWGQGYLNVGHQASSSTGGVALGNFVDAKNASIVFGDDPRIPNVPVPSPVPPGWSGHQPTLPPPPVMSSDMFGNGVNVFAARATGGVVFMTSLATGAPDFLPAAGVAVPAGGGAWDTLSDARAKTDWRTENPEQYLRAIAGMNVRSWRYLAQDASIRHVGPTAQDFRAAFGLGTNDTTISTVDADGANMLAIQALAKRTDELRQAFEKIDALEKRLAQIESMLGGKREQ